MRYLNYMKGVWLGLVGGDAGALLRIDQHNVKALELELELMAPGASIADTNNVRPWPLEGRSSALSASANISRSGPGSRWSNLCTVCLLAFLLLNSMIETYVEKFPTPPRNAVLFVPKNK